MSFEERLALLVDREICQRNDCRQEHLFKQVKLKYPQTAIEDIEARSARGNGRRTVMSVALDGWGTSGHSILISGPTGVSRSRLACALGQYACRRGH